MRKRWKSSKTIGDYEAATLRSKRSRVLCQMEIKVVPTEFPSAQQDSIVEGHLPSALVRRARNRFSADMDQILTPEMPSDAEPYPSDSKRALVPARAEISIEKRLVEPDEIESAPCGNVELRSSEPSDQFGVYTLHADAVRVMLALP